MGHVDSRSAERTVLMDFVGGPAVIQNISAAIWLAAPTIASSSGNGSNAEIQIFDGHTVLGGTCQANAIETLIAKIEAPGGTVGNVDVPFTPGYVLPAGHCLFAETTTTTIGADVTVTGYNPP